MKIKRILLTALLPVLLLAGVNTVLANDNLIADGGFEGELYGEGNWKFTDAGGWYTEGNAEKRTAQTAARARRLPTVA